MTHHISEWSTTEYPTCNITNARSNIVITHRTPAQQHTALTDNAPDTHIVTQSHQHSTFVRHKYFLALNFAFFAAKTECSYFSQYFDLHKKNL